MKGKNRLPPPNQSREELIKAKLEKAGKIRRANRAIESFLKQFKGKTLIQILPVLLRRCPDTFVAKLAIEKIEKHQKLNSEDRAFLEEVKSQIRKEESLS